MHEASDHLPVFADFVFGTVTSLESDELPSNFTLSQNYPNPVNANTTIQYALSAPVKVTLKAYDLLGREVAVLVDGLSTAGEHRIEFDASDLTKGIYFYRLEAGSVNAVRKFILLK